MTTTTTVTKEQKVLAVPPRRKNPSSAQMKSFDSGVTPKRLSQALRFKGYPNHPNTVTDTKNRTPEFIDLYNPSKAVIGPVTEHLQVPSFRT